MKLSMKLGLLAGATSTAAVLLALGCGTDGDDPAAPPQEDGGVPVGDASVDAFPPDADWSYKTYECPVPGGEFPPGQDKWSPLVHLRQAGGGLHIPPIHIMLLADGRVLMPGANMRDTPDAGVIKATSNFIMTPSEPAAETVLEPQELPSLHSGGGESLFCAGHAPLEDGRILLAGGNKEGQYCPDAGADSGVDAGPCVEALQGTDYGMIFDPATSQFTIIPQKMPGGKRWYPAVMRLPNGTMVVTGGDDTAEFVKNHSVDLFDPKTNGWTVLSDEANTPKEVEIASHYVHTHLLSQPIIAEGRPRDTIVIGEGGDVFLFASGSPFEGTQKERWARRTKRPGPISPDVILAHGASGVTIPLIPRNEGRYNQGSILVMGGSEDPNVAQTAQIYDPYQDVWCPASVPLGIPRFQPSTALLPDGNILIVGGTPFPTIYGENLPQRTPQILNPRTGAVWNGNPWPDPYTRGYHTTALLLPDARVIVAGGRTFAGGEPDITTFWDERTDMRYYYPPYFAPILAGKPRITIDDMPQVMGFAAPTTVSYSKGPVDMVALVGLGAQTHCVDMNARHIQLDFAGGATEGGTVTIQGPPNKATAPPGPYMLFLMHAIDGWLVPSVAKVVFLK